MIKIEPFPDMILALKYINSDNNLTKEAGGEKYTHVS